MRKSFLISGKIREDKDRVHLPWTDRRDGPLTIYYAPADDGVILGAARRVWGIAVDGAADVYVSNTSNGRIQKFAVEDMP